MSTLVAVPWEPKQIADGVESQSFGIMPLAVSDFETMCMFPDVVHGAN